VVIDGCPPGLPIDARSFETDLARRRPGRPGTTKRIEADRPLIASGVHSGFTTGAPIVINFENRDVDSSSYADRRNRPRPGHADLPAARKFKGFADHRGGGHFSGRLTVGIVAAGVIAKKIVAPVKIRAELLEAGGTAGIRAAVRRAQEQGDSVGGVVECVASGVPVGLGEPFFDSVESTIAHAAFSIPGIKGIEFGAGFDGAAMKGSAYNDAIIDPDGRTKTNHAGGINGGIANGNEIVFRVAVRPTSSIRIPQTTVDLAGGGSAEITVEGRHDACFALRLPVILEAMVAIVLADLTQVR
jgi:chorismate synthase